jgi:hypothetical protein
MEILVGCVDTDWGPGKKVCCLSDWSYTLDVNGIFMRYFNKPLEVELLGHKINTSKFCPVPSLIKKARNAYKQGRKINAKSWTKETIGNNFNCFKNWNSFILKLYPVRTCRKSGDSFPCFLTLGFLLSWPFCTTLLSIYYRRKSLRYFWRGSKFVVKTPTFILWKFKPQ